MKSIGCPMKSWDSSSSHSAQSARHVASVIRIDTNFLSAHGITFIPKHAAAYAAAYAAASINQQRPATGRAYQPPHTGRFVIGMDDPWCVVRCQYGPCNHSNGAKGPSSSHSTGFVSPLDWSTAVLTAPPPSYCSPAGVRGGWGGG